MERCGGSLERWLIEEMWWLIGEMWWLIREVAHWRDVVAH